MRQSAELASDSRVIRVCKDEESQSGPHGKICVPAAVEEVKNEIIL